MSQWQDIDNYLLSKGVGVLDPEPGQTTRSGEGPGSLHGVGRARDYGDAKYGTDGCWLIYNALLPFAQNGVLEELFWDPSGSGWKNGQDIGPIGGHDNHVHAGIAEGASFEVAAPEPATWVPPVEEQPAEPAPVSEVVVVAPGVEPPSFPLPEGHYFGTFKKDDDFNHSGYAWEGDRPGIQQIAQRLQERGWGGLSAEAFEGKFDDSLDTVVRAFQAQKGLTVDGLVGNVQTWPALWREPITRP